MKHLILIFAFISLNISCFGQVSENVDDCQVVQEKLDDCINKVKRTSETRFPSDTIPGDYLVRGYQVKIAWPSHPDSSKIWMKGSDKFIWGQVFTANNKPLSKPIHLKPPFYTAVTSIVNTSESVLVKFSDESQGIKNSIRFIKTSPKGMPFLNEKPERFSFLFYGCFQPFRVKNGKSEVTYEGNKLNSVMRRMLSRVAKGDQFSYFPDPDVNQISKGQLIEDPRVLIGTGDQVYTDAGYGNSDISYSEHPISAWAYACNNPYSLLDSAEFVNYLDKCYRHFYSFNVFDEIYSKLPSINIWDDHEIRDGWGSHGDEYDSSGKLNKELAPYFKLAKRAFVEHNMMVDGSKDDISDSNKSLEQIREVNSVPIFAFDLRTDRNSCKNKVIDSSQFNSFKKWCNSLVKGQEAIILSSIPFFYEQNDLAVDISGKYLLNGELKDDLIDSWNSETNYLERNKILRELIKLRTRGVKPIIVSGDVHVGGMISVWFDNPVNNKKERLCYELIYSGLSHEKLGEGRNGLKSGGIKRAEKVRTQDPTYYIDSVRYYLGLNVDSLSIYPVYEFTRAKLNFGAIEFSSNENEPTIASLFVIGDNEKSIIERKLELDWNESSESYWNRATFPLAWYFIPWKWGAKRPPEVPYYEVPIDNI